MRKAAGNALCASSIVLLAACSNGVSRFDYPMFANSEADNSITTASLSPIPAEPIYPNGSPARGASVERRDLPPPAPPQQSQQVASASPKRVETIPIRPQPQYRQPQYQTPQRAPQPYAPPPPPQVEYKAPPPVQQPPAPKTVSVQRGDTLYKLSRRYGVSVKEIKSANKMRSTRLSVGQEIIIPGSNAGAPPTPSTTYAVRRGDSPSKIARAHGIPTEDLLSANGLSKRSILRIGQELKIPEQAPPAANTAPEPVRVASRGPSVPIPISNPAREKPVTAVVPKAAPKKKVAARTASLPAPEPMTANQFRWPVRGRIMSGFGKKPNGKHNDGINVAVPKGTAVKAAENGVVAYAGSELEPYGNLILIRHSNNWVTAYAHNDKLLVKRGDTVRRGQVISKAGQSGNVSQPQLHFELRKGSKPVNPLSYMANS
ncbi:MAG: peptidoglycan DD-metalloendopeptidase family protein [Hyphomicrobiaceae bacterium]|nr:peptidoglycan DD-metalloendopeptidase family protein [Hyphomicrobiaceae bacterium]